ncbi:stage II sporulation protein R [Alicyclobacillus macrosporangiidus]|uniref:Stage II sporulation protein R n=1 Tax=Alicyclobacillus macrosporangiidus TaxID=392015 RepID=A0A1I7HU67_9BACL|nr:stage II sporulation protein R [Alicyclobacillus macrosporangiidus]SFU64210.1 stage II sporulation protein R [Alicyclobacillus macrosporangiidus]
MVRRIFGFLAVVAVVVCACRAWLGAGEATPGAATGTTAADLVTSALYNPAEPHAAPIPQDALRLRILANSDSPQDQALKREVRDAVVVQVARLVAGSKDAAEARQRVQAALPDIQRTAADVARQHGYGYPVRADVGVVPFPTKLYGNQVYPAGNYEALRITLGAGQGQNWWCVLFPPLCFVDIADGDAVPNTGEFPDLPPLEVIDMPTMDGGTAQVQVRLASLDYGEELWRWVKNRMDGVALG